MLPCGFSLRPGGSGIARTVIGVVAGLFHLLGQSLLGLLGVMVCPDDLVVCCAGAGGLASGSLDRAHGSAGLFGLALALRVELEVVDAIPV
jgi:hypothetical protein